MRLLKVKLGFLFILLSSSVAFALPSDYRSKIAIEKQKYLWEQVIATRYQKSQIKSDSTLNDGPGIGAIKLFFSSCLSMIFQNRSDEKKEPEMKLIHTYGSVVPIEFEMYSNSRYTGVFSPGRKAGIVRLSLAHQSPPYTPGMAVKILLDGDLDSENFVAMYSLNGQGENRNFFANPFTTVIPEPNFDDLDFLGGLGAKALFSAFNRTVKKLSSNPRYRPESPMNLPLYEAASAGLSENEVPIIPYELVFSPVLGVGFRSDDQEDLRIQLQSLPKDTVIYNIGIKSSAESPVEELGRIITRLGRPTSSKYGDQILLF